MWNLKEFDMDKPLYIAIADAIESDIKLAILKPGERLPAQRELAVKAGVNVTTITRAYTEAEKRGLITSIVGSGTYVKTDSGENPALVNTEYYGKNHIEMGLVSPLYEEEPDITQLAEKILQKSDIRELMRYTQPQGIYRQREIGSTWISRFGVHTVPENIIITAGAQHALICIFSSVFQPGDHIAVDCLTYPGVKTAARICGIRLEAVPMDREGMLPDGLSSVCGRSEIKGVYTVSTMQNPTNAVMSEQRCADIAEIIKEHNLLLIEDDLYRFLAADKNNPLTCLVPEQSIYIASVSKAFYAGLRTCFVASPQKYCNRITQSVVDTIWMAPSLNAELACTCITSGIADKIIQRKQIEIKRRAGIMKSKLHAYTYQYEPDSMFAWLKLPDGVDSNVFETVASDNGISIVSSWKFSTGMEIPPDYIRFSLSGADCSAEFEKGLDILFNMLDRRIGVPGGIF